MLPLRLICAIHCAFLGLTAAMPAGAAAPAPIKLYVGGRALALSHPAVYDGREVYVPLESLQAFGAAAQINQRGDAARIVFADGRSAEIAVARPGGQAMLPLSEMTAYLGADTVVGDSTCRVRARIRDVAFERGCLRVATSFALPARGRTTGDKDHPSFTLELLGAALPAGIVAPRVPSGENRLTGIRVEPSQDGVQIVMSFPAGVTAGADLATERVHAVSLAGAPVQVTAKVETKPETPRTQAADGSERPPPVPQRTAQSDSVQPPDSVDTRARPGPTPLETRAGPSQTPVRSAEAPRPAPGQVVITGVDFQSADSAHARLRVTTRGKPSPSVVILRDPPRLAIDVPNSQVETDQHDWKVDHPFLSAIHALVSEKLGATRIVLDLARVVGYRLLEGEGYGITLDLSLPRNSGIRLGEATVVIDPGHGGTEATGCWAVVDGHKVYEKNITLSVARMVRNLFQEAGSNVLLTRTTDADVSLSARPTLANDNNAAVFVSIHVDDMPGSSRPSGSTAYYHFDDPSGRALAQCIIEQIGRVSGLPNRGARSDRTLYHSGLAVLRKSGVPAALVEMGFLSNPGDRQKLLDGAFQHMIAQAIFDGVRAYLESGFAGFALPERIAE